MALKIKVVVGDDGDGGDDDTELTNELRKRTPNTRTTTKKAANQPKTCLCASETKHGGYFRII